MKVEKKDLGKSQMELTVELTVDEFKPYIVKGAEKVSQEIKINGFRPGKIPYAVLKDKIGEMSLLEEGARIAINKTVDKAIMDNMGGRVPVGQPEVNITKLAPGNPLEYKVVMAILPEVKLGNYKNLKIKKNEIKADDKEADKAIDYLLESRVKEAIVGREAKEGDKVIISVEMFLDNVPIDGGQKNDMPIVLGKDYIVPGFDKQLLKSKKGETREFKLPYPKDFHMANLAGKMVEFKVKIKEVYERQMPKADDEFAKQFGLNNMEELKNNIKKSLAEEKRQKEGERQEIELITKIIDKSDFGDIPEVLINNEAETMVYELKHGIEHQGGKFADYLSSIKKTEEQLKLDMAPNAVKRVKSALIIRAIGDKEKIEAGEKDIDREVEKLLKQYQGYEKVTARVKDPEYRAYLHNTLTSRKVVEKLKEWNVEK
ncbi:trigger factor [Candidatus Falkowbacteria bacterium CG_4_9_14_3_um_filter_36_9]|uniref:Trigger factor n=2 Tax=Candidatus Falkowiibacteriota TaxID=1752728 RepID=A0A1J4T928_9BACT|nr:MAG: trigger factor [Candidatus Falkowbacteria bacterium CG1_02_37_44]PIV51369.1 MAG: trigger factor [Candidatus Falkowbacteria bacterium CG02_land_8_20_14_3_00_36_14]PIX11608.1 MAG: trigger factor [Candidatus Falkowbacteria bacterium CG_4_8_14_3_um_filter_36_11]PJA10295.1 MAG: trigger factor [Candidatus Falkowbacteria bacterium CG_4_10_14_0_2_um_filter_36_22]PJB18500.1 MAG: trigger factor [Candidatus Falkowbacteria bacterium CG_4_9_14_3_um_filter_36_9]